MPRGLAHDGRAAADPWHDLAGNRAGAMARTRAEQLRSAAPRRTAVARVLGLHTDERAWRIGARGEEMVAARLARLRRKDPRWHVLHAIPVGRRGSDIDHLVVGPAGVFTINTKHHPGAKIWVAGDTFLVNGRRYPYVRNSRHEASRAARLLDTAGCPPVVVRGLIVPVRAEDVTIREMPTDVAVVPRFQLTRWLLRQPHQLDDAALARVYQTARRSTTWAA